MKKFLALFMVLWTLAVPALAEQRVFDEANLLSASTENRLEQAISDVASAYQFDVVIATVPHTNNRETKYFAADFYDYGSFGYNSTHDGILLLIVSSTRQYYILNTGIAEQIFSDSVLYDIEDDVVPYLRQNNYDAATLQFVAQVQSRLQLHTPLGRANALFPFLLAFGLIAALVTTLIFKAQMKTVRRQTSASRYIRQGSFQLNRMQDIYLYTTQSRVRIETSSGGGDNGGGGGGGFTGSSGTHHSGHGGGF
ncbi:MAG: TPM domain-containing protein [Clostridia bacterium]|nr:TPM domain-containing protein [Clostridia bacterium]